MSIAKAQMPIASVHKKVNVSNVTGFLGDYNTYGTLYEPLVKLCVIIFYNITNVSLVTLYDIESLESVPTV